MVEGAVGRPWTTDEDQLLIQAVRIHGDNTEKWKTIALVVPGRTNKACRKRWLHSLSPSIKKTAWTPDEDRLLLSLYAKYSAKWSVIARHIPGRTDDACSKRYREALDPSLKKDEWTEDEDAKLLECHARLGGRWGQVGQELQRSGLGCRNRWRLLERKKNAVAKQTQPGREMALAPRRPAVELMPSIPESMPISSCDQLESNQTRVSLLESTIDLQESPMFHDSLSNADPISPMTAIAHGLAIDEHLLHQPRSCSPPPFSYTSSSLSAALSEPQAASQTPTTQNSGTSGSPICALSSAESADTHDPSWKQIVDSLLTSESDFDISHNDNCHRRELNTQPVTTTPTMLGVPSDPESNVGGMTEALPLRCQEQSLSDLSILLAPSASVTPNCVSNHHMLFADTMRLVPSTLMSSRPAKRQRIAVEITPMSSCSKHAHSTKAADPPRLSSKLPATSDPFVLAYACGHSDCCSSGASIGDVRFATSGELSDHFKERHPSSYGGSNDHPFRCGLEGCDKGWKSINGLQYHLQISKAHFDRAVPTSTIAVEPESDLSVFPSSSVPTVHTPRRRKIHPCPHESCTNQYKQLSGLRYHLLHGHPSDSDVQSNIISSSVSGFFDVQRFYQPP